MATNASARRLVKALSSLSDSDEGRHKRHRFGDVWPLVDQQIRAGRKYEPVLQALREGGLELTMGYFKRLVHMHRRMNKTSANQTISKPVLNSEVQTRKTSVLENQEPLSVTNTSGIPTWNQIREEADNSKLY